MTGDLESLLLLLLYTACQFGGLRAIAGVDTHRAPSRQATTVDDEVTFYDRYKALADGQLDTCR